MTVTPAKTRHVAIELAAIAFGSSLIWLGKWVVFGSQPLSGDGRTYLDMAKGNHGVAPWSFHVLTPRLAGALFPDNPSVGFFWIAAVSFVGTAILIDLLLRGVRLDLTLRERVLGVTLFIGCGTATQMFRAYYMTDSLSYFLLAASCTASVYRLDSLVALTTFVGVFNRETALFVLPVWLAMNIGTSSVLQIAKRLALVMGPAVAGYVILHFTPLILGFMPAHFDYMSWANILTLWNTTLAWLGTDNIYYGLAICIFLAYGPLWFMAAAGALSLSQYAWTRRRPTISLWILALPVLFTLLIVDWKRGFQPLFPAMIVSSVIGIRQLSAARPRYCWSLLAATTAVASAITTDAWSASRMHPVIITAMVPWIAVASFVLTRPGSPE